MRIRGNLQSRIEPIEIRFWLLKTPAVSLSANSHLLLAIHNTRIPLVWLSPISGQLPANYGQDISQSDRLQQDSAPPVRLKRSFGQGSKKAALVIESQGLRFAQRFKVFVRFHLRQQVFRDGDFIQCDRVLDPREPDI